MTIDTADHDAGARLRHLPVSFFSMVMGLAGLTLATHKMAALHGWGGLPGLVLFGLSATVFLVLAVLYALKAMRHPAAVVEEWRHPVRIAFFPSASIGLILLGTAALPVDAALSRMIWGVGAAAHLVLTVMVLSSWLDHSHYEVPHSNPAWFIPVVGNILVPIAGMRHAHADISWLFFSIGLVFWLILLTIILYRLIFHNPLPAKLLPTLFILLAPPSAGFLSWLALNGGVIDAPARLLYFTAVFFLLLLTPKLPTFARQDFALSWWAFSFPLAAFAIATLTMAERAGVEAYLRLGEGLFAILGVLVLGLAGRTILAVRRGEICKPE